MPKHKPMMTNKEMNQMMKSVEMGMRGSMMSGQSNPMMSKKKKGKKGYA